MREPERASLKTPPSWNPNNNRYSFREWKSDLELWMLGTDLAEQKQCGAIALQLTGEARDIAREMDRTVMRNGVQMPDGTHKSGAQCLIELLEEKLGPQQQSKALDSLDRFFTFRRKQKETIDEMISRFELVFQRASVEGGLNMSYTGIAYKLAEVCGLRDQELLVMLGPLNGALPYDATTHRTFVEHIRRHIQRTEKDKSWAGPVMEEEEEEHQWPEDYEDPDWYPEDEHETGELYEELYYLGDEDESEEVDDESAFLSYLAARRVLRQYKGKGKGRKGNGKSKGKSSKAKASGSAYPVAPGKSYGKGKNPPGKDGKIMRCSICDSQYHLRARCPKNTNPGGHPFSNAASQTPGKGSGDATWTVWHVSDCHPQDSVSGEHS
eukprot:6460216-Amphidinium_carterae.1